jgi:hypothetical protein
MITTFVTALFDIDRENKGDGRKTSEYLEWFKNTLKLNCNLFIVIEEKFYQFVLDNRPKEYKTYIKIDNLKNAKYYKYIDRMKEILDSKEYKEKIAYPDRVECKLPEYNIIQYSKFGWLEDAIKINPFNGEYFFWMDAGLSRFFNRRLNMNFPTKGGLNKIFRSDKKFIIQGRKNLNSYNIDEIFKWKADNLLKGGIFGGYKDNVIKVSELLEDKFNKEMLDKDNVNNEQLCLAYVWKENKFLFNVIEEDRHPAYIFNIL